MNLAYKSCRRMVLLLSGDVETNPGPCTILKSVQGSFHQGDVRLGTFTGIQCMCNSLFAIVWSALKKISFWNPGDLDHILSEGTKWYTNLGYTNQYLSELPNSFVLENEVIQIQSLENVSHIITDDSTSLRTFHNSSDSHKGQGMVGIISGVSFAIVWDHPQIYLFDPHSRTSLGQITEQGTSVLLKFDSLQHVESYIREIYVTPGEAMCFETQYFKILTTEQITGNIMLNIRRKRKLEQNRKYRESERGRVKQKNSIGKYQKTEHGQAKLSESISKYRKTEQGQAKVKKSIGKYQKTEQGQAKVKKSIGKYQKTEKGHAKIKESIGKYQNTVNGRSKLRESKSKYKKTEQGQAKQRESVGKYRETEQGQQGQKTAKKRHVVEGKATKRKRVNNLPDSDEKINQFKKCIENGPFFICVICNRSLYRRSIKFFRHVDYPAISEEHFCFRVQSFDGKEYICATCHSKLTKRKIPSQAVSNNLQMFDLPESMSTLRRLEKIIISKRILFKRIAIMPKGQCPKIKGAICNVPIKADEISNVLPRGMDNNGVVQVALKKKTEFQI
ncbi:uncharacterized protein LOC130628722 [Hydractinia symbiolongicarpus]|uniref:uncharacterized protein LOC130628722 n=1 Tax=Hydractinia symbiolongicarpus TaxID=13093 RepID=UPI00254B3505|nr:uncharacterized protein LOC130628722 [Hydractinia symbiolongicarpus]XP_057297690.1 uncharacterized protein LOC130628722 [Hydractinia symbiolongicarpus]XP_057297691.1 uncharacterized protein LOC130628722 [Hydractinia symbiolongicarpus]